MDLPPLTWCPEGLEDTPLREVLGEVPEDDCGELLAPLGSLFGAVKRLKRLENALGFCVPSWSLPYRAWAGCSWWRWRPCRTICRAATSSARRAWCETWPLCCGSWAESGQKSMENDGKGLVWLHIVRESSLRRCAGGSAQELGQLAELVLRCCVQRRRVEGDTLHCWVTRQDLAEYLEERREIFKPPDGCAWSNRALYTPKRTCWG